MKIITIATVPSRTFPDEPFFSSLPNTEIRFTDDTRAYAAYRSFRVFGWTKDHADRIVDGGPKVQGPQAFLSQNGSAITAHKQEDPIVINASIHDIFEIDGVNYEPFFEANNNFGLRPYRG